MQNNAVSAIKACMKCFLGLLVLVCTCIQARATDCLIAVDAGHTRKMPGAISARGTGEWHFNMRLAKKLAALLDKEGISYVLVNPDGDTPSLGTRMELALKAGATLFLSLHHDSVQPQYLSGWEWKGEKRFYSDDFSGYSLFVSAQNPYYQQSRDVAGDIADSLLEKGLKPTLHHAEPIAGENRRLLDKARGIYQFDELMVLRESSAAAVLVEAGVIVNRQEELALASPAYQEKITGALVTAVQAHCQRIRD